MLLGILDASCTNALLANSLLEVIAVAYFYGSHIALSHYFSYKHWRVTF